MCERTIPIEDSFLLWKIRWWSGNRKEPSNQSVRTEPGFQFPILVSPVFEKWQFRKWKNPLFIKTICSCFVVLYNTFVQNLVGWIKHTCYRPAVMIHYFMPLFITFQTMQDNKIFLAVFLDNSAKCFFCTINFWQALEEAWDQTLKWEQTLVGTMMLFNHVTVTW